jgi:uncharacterized protein
MVSSVRVSCPTCQREVAWATARYRPFCSERCRLLDFGAWLSGQRALPGEAAAAAPNDEAAHEAGPQRPERQ